MAINLDEIKGICCNRCDREIGPYEQAWKEFPDIVCEDCIVEEETHYFQHGYIEELI